MHKIRKVTIDTVNCDKNHDALWTVPDNKQMHLATEQSLEFLFTIISISHIIN